MSRLGLLVVLMAAPLIAGADFPEAAKLPARPELPDPLVTFDGKRIGSKEEWFFKRRPELKELFQHYMYGHLPAVEKVTGQVLREDPKALDGKATLREVAISVGAPENPPIQLLLVVPNNRKGPAPVFVGMNFGGNHLLLKDPGIRLPTTWVYSNYPGVVNNRATDAGRGAQAETWCLDQAIERGYAVATFYSGDIDPDRATPRGGLYPYTQQRTLARGEIPDCGAIALWAWGIHRVVDYLESDRDVDRERIAVVGHSRLGKTALVAAAFDERIALAIPSQAGCGGTAPSRGKIGESVKRINDSFPHWFCANFKQFNTQPERLPFDQNGLVALVAPRPVLFCNAEEDTWANPDGQFQVLQAADPVYRFLGVEGLEAKERPQLNQLLDSRLGYFIRPGKHSMSRVDWKAYLDFADKHLGKPVR